MPLKYYIWRIKNRYDNLYNREAYDNILDDPNSLMWSKLNSFLIFTIIYSIFILVIESVPDLKYKFISWLYYSDFFVSTIFLIEYLYRFSRTKQQFWFLFRPMNIIDLLSFIPFFISLIFKSYNLSDFLIFRAFRILKLLKYIPLISWFMKALKDYRDEYRWVWILFIVILSIFSIVVYHIEHINNPQFSSIPQAIWWWIVTMWTVWYGDIVPITPLWKVIWSALIVLWPVLLSVLSWITILVFMDVAETQRDKLNRWHAKVCHRCKTRNPRQSNYCMRCWENIEDNFKLNI